MADPKKTYGPPAPKKSGSGSSSGAGIDYGSMPTGGVQTDKKPTANMGPKGNMDVDTAYNQIYTYQGNSLVALQMQMYNAGFYGNAKPSSIQWGYQGNETLNAFAQVVEATAGFNSVGDNASFLDVIARAGMNNPNAPGRNGSGGSGSGRRVQYQYTNPEDLKAVADSVAQDTLGRKLTDQEANDFVALYHGIQQKSQKQAFSGGTVVSPEDPSVAAKNMLEKNNETEADAYSVAGQFQNFVGLLKGMV